MKNKPTGRPQKPFWSRVNVTDTCWLWTGPKNADGYGQVRVKGRLTMVHRMMYELACGGGKIPDGFVIRHSCHTPNCVRPDHLSIGTHKDNMQDMIKAGRQVKEAPYFVGEKHPGAKLTLAQVKVIRAKLAKGANQKDLAEKYGVARQTIGNIATGHRWGKA